MKRQQNHPSKMLSSIIRRTNDSLANVKFSTTTGNVATSMITVEASSSLRRRSRPSSSCAAAPLTSYKLNGICTNFTTNRNLLIVGLIFIIVICNGSRKALKQTVEKKISGKRFTLIGLILTSATEGVESIEEKHLALAKLQKMLVVLQVYDWRNDSTYLMSYIADGALRNVNLIIEPPAVRRGQHAILRCMYDLEGAPLYSAKFYRGQLEFYRYTPGEFPNTKVTSSNATQVLIRNVGFGLSGNFSCEVTADAPLFSTATAIGTMQVVGKYMCMYICVSYI
uniref:Ig-like domain-containing protein n=1 Tax=Glossina morsitans morsitans TaxID=37546 RepID=A0A1B0FMN4_GLOMM